MPEKPILFSDPMVRAILEGRKTQTRRIVKPPRRIYGIWDGPETWHVDPGGTALFGPGPYVKMGWWHTGDLPVIDPKGYGELGRKPPDDLRCVDRVRCPYGYPEDGARLWVREAHQLIDVPGVGPTAWYRADGTPAYVDRWRPSIHMPRWACRLVLRITRVRVERLQEIRESDDAVAEGYPGPDWRRDWGAEYSDWCDPVTWFRVLWDRLNGKRAPWANNPWVWALDFEVER
jgi:hypothetical protein